MTKEEAQNDIAQKHFKTDWVNILRLIVKQKDGLTISKFLEMEDEVLELYAETKVKNLSSNNGVSGSLPLLQLPELLQWMKKREINWDAQENAWEEFVGHDTPNYYTTEELIKEWESGNDR